MAFLYTLLLCIFLLFFRVPASEVAKTHIVYLGHRDHDLQPSEIVNSHILLLAEVLGSKEAARDALVYNYKHGFSGFAAKLTKEQAERLSESESVISVFPSGKKILHTTQSWDFLGLSDGTGLPSALWEKTQYGKDVIIGSIDSGIWPESKSFSDDDMEPVPERWRGTCDFGEPGFSCNKKIIGARYYTPNSPTARDIDGHGTHTASTAAGRFVPNVSINGFGNGTARGGASLARLAAYKVCEEGCAEDAILAAIDQAIHDGVDILTISLGPDWDDQPDFFTDGTAIGGFHAIEHGITVVTSGGNSGPNLGTVANGAPWFITVAASTTDRKFSAQAVLGNNAVYKGESFSEGMVEFGTYPLVAGKDVYQMNSDEASAELCLTDSLDPDKVRGKIVVCGNKGNNIKKGEAVKDAGGAGMIICNGRVSGDALYADFHVLPALALSYSSCVDIFSYMNSTECPTAYISPSETEMNFKPAPQISSFSSVGPSSLAPDVLKPDITAPGVNILAAFTEKEGAEDAGPYRFDSGTSMACPHVAGIAALLKAYHPEWSHAAIRSALTTTAYVVDNTKQIIHTQMHMNKIATPLHFGGGHVNPNAAVYPGLIYNTTINDYIQVLCSLGYKTKHMRILTKQAVKCSKPLRPVSALNLPSITLTNFKGTTETVTRIVTNVGNATSVYRAYLQAPAGVKVRVHPPSLKFSKIGEQKSFTVTFKLTCPKNEEGEIVDCAPLKNYVFGSLTWKDGIHSVRIPLTIRLNLFA